MSTESKPLATDASNHVAAVPDRDKDRWEANAVPDRDKDRWEANAVPDRDKDRWEANAVPDRDKDRWEANAVPDRDKDRWELKARTQHLHLRRWFYATTTLAVGLLAFALTHYPTRQPSAHRNLLDGATPAL